MTLCDYLTKDRLKCITIVLASSMIISINNGIMYVPGIYVPYWREEMNASRFELDFIGSLQMGFAFCQGLGIGMLYMSAVVAVTTNFDEKRPIAMGIVTCGTGLGVSSMSFFIPLLLKKTGWRSSMYILSGLSICLALFGACLISRKNQKHRSSSTYFTDVLPRGIFEDVQLPVQLYGSTRELNSAIKLTDLVDVRYGHHLLGNLGSYFYMTQINQIHLKDLRKKKKALSLLIIPEYDLYLAGMLLLSCVFIVPFIFIYDWLTIKGFSANQISIVLLMNGVFGGFSRLLIGFVSNMKCSKVVIILLFCLGISGILSISCTYFNEPWQYAIYSAIDGICCGK
ncbi:unnamed protein product [Trichobilharzia regenti]|nr:unnamed protein product [Trichobilharzia regenti]